MWCLFCFVSFGVALVLFNALVPCWLGGERVLFNVFSCMFTFGLVVIWMCLLGLGFWLRLVWRDGTAGVLGCFDLCFAVLLDLFVG